MMAAYLWWGAVQKLLPSTWQLRLKRRRVSFPRNLAVSITIRSTLHALLGGSHTRSLLLQGFCFFANGRRASQQEYRSQGRYGQDQSRQDPAHDWQADWWRHRGHCGPGKYAPQPGTRNFLAPGHD